MKLSRQHWKILVGIVGIILLTVAVFLADQRFLASAAKISAKRGPSRSAQSAYLDQAGAESD